MYRSAEMVTCLALPRFNDSQVRRYGPQLFQVRSFEEVIQNFDENEQREKGNN